MERQIERPVEAPSWRQLGVLVLDGSQSMKSKAQGLQGFDGTKAEAVSLAVRDLFGRFRVSYARANFTFAVVSFHQRVSHVMTPTPVEDIDEYANYDPTSHGSGGTFIGAGLEAALEICQKFLSEGREALPTSAVVLLMTDGECSAPDRTRNVAARLLADRRIKLAASFFATKGQPQSPGVGLLRSICSEPKQEYFRLVYDAESLRKFWTASMSSAVSAVGEEPGQP